VFGRAKADSPIVLLPFSHFAVDKVVIGGYDSGMRTEQEVKDHLKELKKDLAVVKKRFKKYDNSDDLEVLIEITAMIDAVTWVLAK
jgi:hypothetical protein